MQQYAYTPGTCNIDEKAESTWDAIGTIGISAWATFWLIFMLWGLPGYWEVAFVPGWIGFFGIWQSRLPLCSFRNAKAISRMHFFIAMLAVVAVTSILGAGLLISPMPASGMQKFYMRLLQAL